MIAFETKYLGVFQLPNGLPVHVRKRLTGWSDGVQFWVHDWKETGWFSWFYSWQYSGNDEEWLAKYND